MAVQNDNTNEIQLKTPSKTGSLVGVLLILLVVGGYAFYVRSLANEVDAGKIDLSEKIDQVEALELEIETLDAAKEELGLTSEVAQIEIQRSIPPGMNQDEVIRDLIEIGETHDIILSSISFGQGATDQENIASLRVNASFEGNYNDLINFLEGLEQNARLFVVNSISVQLSRLAISDIQRANFSLSIEAFFQQ